ncbi:MAG: AzlD domain-containing protein [Acidimicrobiia bacterium]|nr:AzlD domain-containing protein [Acidimicrobiia bacterium]
MTAWLAFVLGGLATYAMRASFILFVARRSLPPAVERALRYVGPAVFAAIVFPLTLGDDGLARLAKPDARLLALVVGAGVMWRTRNMMATLSAGMLTLWLLQSQGW